MLLPISHEDGALRRLPWVTFGIMGLCLLVFLLTDFSAVGRPTGPDAALEEAADYWRRHAYLEAHPDIRERVAKDVRPSQRRQYLETLRAWSEPRRPSSEEALAEQRAELARLTERALEPAAAPTRPEDPFRRWGVIPNRPRAHALVTHMFLHAGWIHLIGNLFLLLVMGPAIEDRWGRLTYGVVYLGSGVFAALLFTLMSQDGSLPMVGASGAIAGVLGAFLVRLWRTKIRFAYFFLLGILPLWGTFEAAAWLMLPLWVGIELFQALFWDALGVQSGVAYWAHVGGFLAGAAGASAVKASRLEERLVDPSIERKVTLFEASPALEQALQARERGDLEEALAILEREWRRNPEEDVSLALWDAALSAREPERGAPALASAVRGAARRGDHELALRHWSELAETVPSARIEPATLMHLLPPLLEEGSRERAVRALREIVHPENAALTPGQASRVVELAREVDPPSALAAARQALAFPELDASKRSRLEALVAELERGGVAAPDAGTAATAAAAAAAPAAAAAGRALPVEEGHAVDLARFGRAKLTPARPLGLDERALRLALGDEREAAVSLSKIQAVSVAIVRDLGPKPVLLVDLLANWNEAEAELLRGVRLRSSQFDPRRLLGVEGSPQQAFARFVGRLLERSGGVPLPDAEAALGKPFARFDTLRAYESEVLQVAAPEDAGG